MKHFRTFVIYTEPHPEDPALLVPVKELLLDHTAIEYTGFDVLKNLIDEVEPRAGFRPR